MKRNSGERKQRLYQIGHSMSGDARKIQDMFRMFPKALEPVSVQVAMTVSDGQFQQAKPSYAGCLTLTDPMREDD